MLGKIGGAKFTENSGVQKDSVNDSALEATLTSAISSFQAYPNDPKICVGTIQTPRGVGTCILLHDGTILTTLHNIFDISGYASAYHMSLDQRSPVNNYFDAIGDIELYFIDGNNVLQKFSVGNIGVNGLPALQCDERLQIPGGGWDFVILEPTEDLKAKLNSTGLLLDETLRTYGRSLLTTDEATTKFAPPHQRNTPSSSKPEVRAYDPGCAGMPLEVKSAMPNTPSSSGSVSLRKNGNNYSAVSLVYTDGSEIFICEILYRIKDIQDRKLSVDPRKYHEFLAHSPILRRFVMQKGQRAFDEIIMTGSKQNTENRNVDLTKVPLTGTMLQIVDFFDPKKARKLPFCRIQIDNIKVNEHTFYIALIVRRSDKYLAGVEATFKGTSFKIGCGLKGFSQVDERYPEDTRRINTHPFSARGIEAQLLNLNNRTIQAFFDYFIQVMEISKLPVIAALNSVMVDYEEKSGMPTTDLIAHCLTHGNSEIPLSDGSGVITVPYSLTKLPVIMAIIKANYGKLAGIATRIIEMESVPPFAEYIELLKKELGSTVGAVEFIREFIYPILDVLGCIAEDQRDKFTDMIFSSPDAATFLRHLEPYESNIRVLFTPIII